MYECGMKCVNLIATQLHVCDNPSQINLNLLGEKI